MWIKCTRRTKTILSLTRKTSSVLGTLVTSDNYQVISSGLLPRLGPMCPGKSLGSDSWPWARVDVENAMRKMYPSLQRWGRERERNWSMKCSQVKGRTFQPRLSRHFLLHRLKRIKSLFSDWRHSCGAIPPRCGGCSPSLDFSSSLSENLVHATRNKYSHLRKVPSPARSGEVL